MSAGGEGGCFGAEVVVVVVVVGEGGRGEKKREGERVCGRSGRRRSSFGLLEIRLTTSGTGMSSANSDQDNPASDSDRNPQEVHQLTAVRRAM